MKKIFTKTLGFVAAIILFVGIALPASAQFVKKSFESNNEFYTAVTKDPAGNIYAIRSADGVHASVIKYAPNSTSFATLFSGLAAGGGDESNAGFLAWGLAVNSHGDVYCTTNLSTGNTTTGTNVVNGSALTNHGNVIKLASNNGYAGTSYTASVFLNGGLFYSSLAFDTSDNLYVVQTDNTSLSHYTVRRYPPGNTSGTELFNDLNDDATDNYPHGLALASNGDIYVCDAGQKSSGGTSGHTGGVRHYVNSSGTYSSHTNVSTGTYPMALALDGSGNLYVSETDGTAYANYRLNKYNASSHALTAGNITTPLVASGGILPDGITAISDRNIFVAAGGNPSEFFELIGPATTPASGINFTATATTTTTINWTIGDGDSRAVFVALASSGTPTLVNSTNYTASTTFSSGTQAGSGWYCVYNGTGTSVSVTGLTAGNTYRAMVVEYTGSVALTDENYLTTSNAGNTANVITLSPTTINSINRVTGQYSNGSSVNFLATFGARVTGVTASNFSVTASGISGASIGTPTTGDGGTTWTVPVSTGTGDGTIQLNLANATGLSATISTSLPFPGQAYTIDKTAPTIGIGNPSLSSTTGGPVSYTVTYNDGNFNSSTLSAGNITLNGTATGTVAVTGTGATRTVTISSITGNGTLGISIAAGTATDFAGNTAPAAGPSTTFNVDNTAPTATITRASTSPTNASSITYNIKFSEPVTGATSGQFNISASAGITAYSVGTFSGSGDTYTYTLNSIAENAVSTITLNLNGGSNIIDAAGNVAAAATGETYTIDQIAPTVTSIVRAAGATNPTNATDVHYTITFSEAVSGLGTEDFNAVAATGDAAGTVNSVGSTDGGISYDVAVTGITGTGQLRLDLKASGTGIVDGPGNQLADGGFTGASFDIDNTGPVLASVTAPVDGTYGQGGVLQFTVHFDEAATVTGSPVLNFTMDSGNKQASFISSSGTDLIFRYTVVSGDFDPDGIELNNLALNGGTIKDDLGNDANTATLHNVPLTGVLVDAVAPTVTSIVPADATPTKATSVDFTVTFSKPVTGPAYTNFSTTGTASGTPSVISGSGTTYTVTVSGVSGDGTLGLNLNASGSGIFDDNSNQLVADFTGGSAYTIDNTAPTVNISAPSVAVATQNSDVTYTVTYNDVNFASATLSSTDVSVPVSGAVSYDRVDVSKTSTNTYDVIIRNVTGSGSAGISIAANTASDQAGNPAPAAGPSTTFTIYSNDATLSNLTASVGTLDPPFLPGTTTGYTVNVPNETTSIKITPTANTALISGLLVRVNSGGYEGVTSGNSSADLPLNVGANTIDVQVTAQDETTQQTYTLTVNRAASNNALLTILTLNPGAKLTRVSGPDHADYTATVSNSISSVKVKPITSDPTATLTVNGNPSTPGAESDPITLNSDTTSIAVTVTAGDGVTKNTYRMVLTRAPSNNARLTVLTLNPGAMLTRVSGPDYADYTATVSNSTASVKVKPITSDAGATLTVNGNPSAPGAESDPITLNADTTSIAVTVTAPDGVTKNTYRMVLTRAPSNNARLTVLTLNPGATLTRVSGPDYADYTATVPNSTATIKVKPITSDPMATLTVNGNSSAPGAESAPVTLNADTTSIAVTVTAQDGTTRNSYVIKVTRLAPPPAVMAYEQEQATPAERSDVVVHGNVSPNGDGNSDVMQIDGIGSYPDNRVQIMSRSGNLVFETKGYDNTTKVFDGHSNDGKLQQAGTYFYSLEYKVGSETKHKTGYIVLKY